MIVDKLAKHLYFSENTERYVETLFLMESPHTEELNEGFPCMGATGCKMSEILVNNISIPIGRLIKEGNPATRIYALFETFKFPLKPYSKEEYDSNELIWMQMKILDSRSYSSRKDRFVALNQFFEKNAIAFPNTYQSCLESAVRLFENLKEIAICGNIAQTVFMHFFEIDDPGGGQRVKKLIAEKSLDLYFVEHPAASLYDSSNRPWAYRQEIAPTISQKKGILKRGE